MSARTKPAPSTWVLESPSPGIGQIRKVDHREVGTRRAQKIHDTICTVCLKPIGTERFIEVNGVPKHERHMRGQ